MWNGTVSGVEDLPLDGVAQIPQGIQYLILYLFAFALAQAFDDLNDDKSRPFAAHVLRAVKDDNTPVLRILQPSCFPACEKGWQGALVRKAST